MVENFLDVDKQMKIKTITCHNVYNVGASLQAYALASYLKSLNHEVEIIDYLPDYLVRHKLIGGVSDKYNYPLLKQMYYLAKFPGRLKERLSQRKKEFDRFTKQYLPLTAKRYSSNEELKNDPPDADVFFAGSDQIWNTLFPNGKDPAFYLDFVSDNAVKASYAASFATKEIDQNYIPTVNHWLSNLDYISVRERTGVDIVRQLEIENVTQVLDPVFLLSADQWKEIEKDLKIDEPYVLLYDFDNSETICEYALFYSRKHNCKIYSFLPSAVAERCFYQEGPAAFIYLINNADLIISNSFHATAFSVIFRKQFVVFNRSESINTRMADFIGALDLSDRLVGVSNDPGENIIDYSIVSHKLSEQIEHSKQYINMVLESVGL